MTSIKDTVVKAFQGAKRIREEGERAARERADLARYHTGDSIYFAIEKVPSKQGEPDRVRARAVSGLPGTDTTLVTYGRDADEALFEARHELITIYWQNRLPGDDWHACRAKATSAKLEIFSLDLTV
jgi:hypothetical protein